ncbi:MAG: protein-L-isoaspartate(D-aspartate) O-methyltransferase [Thermodesulfobacteriota bacterium]
MSHDFTLSRERMVKHQLIARGIKDERVLRAMGKIPRHLFIEDALYGEAYNDHPVPIGEKQTISQPYMVALMTETLELKGYENTLEIGTGSGYQTAILAELSSRVYTIERIKSLLGNARKVLFQLGYDNILFKVSDGTLGWKEYAPFDAIMVTAGAPYVTKPLIDQLADNGRMIIPVGDRYSQELIKVIRKGKNIEQKNLGGCRFVNLIGAHSWSD